MKRRQQRSDRPGFTLTEVLIASFLFLLLLTIISSVIVPSLRIWSQTQEESSLYQETTLAFRQLTHDIENSLDARFDPQEQKLWFYRGSLQKEDPQRGLYCYYQKENFLVREHYASPLETLTLENEMELLESRNFCHRLESFKAQPLNENSSSLVLELTLVEKEKSSKEQRFQLRTTVYPQYYQQHQNPNGNEETKDQEKYIYHLH